jgi:hypothetical protein
LQNNSAAKLPMCATSTSFGSSFVSVNPLMTVWRIMSAISMPLRAQLSAKSV